MPSVCTLHLQLAGSVLLISSHTGMSSMGNSLESALQHAITHSGCSLTQLSLTQSLALEVPQLILLQCHIGCVRNLPAEPKFLQTRGSLSSSASLPRSYGGSTKIHCLLSAHEKHRGNSEGLYAHQAHSTILGKPLLPIPLQSDRISESSTLGNGHCLFIDKLTMINERWRMITAKSACGVQTLV